ncbi:hypothetical protein [Maribacter arcticus]|uniref:Uncharacterized protein n=1 Tax=Maribacter arcticus TaxID=561365 RepID=A0A1T5AJY7_9FLAO|nr:hypothetical protein [Maribacter arcticus]SKB35149.1 hypothetical protein SAMN05660866_01034 [Maribacter arcticus]
MKNYFALIACLCFFSTTYAINLPNTLKLISNDSVIVDNVVYRLFPTENMWTFIKLNTRNGQMWQVQFDVGGDNRFETFLNEFPLVLEEFEDNGRFTLYPTQNTYNFILVDQIDGRLWQAQWSMKSKNRGIIPIN